MILPAGTYFFPANLPYYVTKWDVSLASEVRFSAVVFAGAPGVVIRPVFDAELAVLLSGSEAGAYFSTGIAASTTGFFVTEWEPINEDAKFIGNIYVGIVVEIAEDTDEADFTLGLAEVQIR